ncbi:hypothetical protein JCM21900_004250 [Sporobolomyces salmonicolor]
MLLPPVGSYWAEGIDNDHILRVSSTDLSPELARHVDCIGRRSPYFSAPSGELCVPRDLPSPPEIDSVDEKDLELDEEMDGVPVAFARDAFRQLAPVLLESSARTAVCKLAPSQPADPPPASMRCIPPPPPQALPTHILAITFSETGNQHFVPIHGVVWALQCPPLSLASKPPPQPDSHFELPVLPLTLPSEAAWPLVNSFIHHNSPAQLTSDLLVAPRPFPPSAPPPPSLDQGVPFDPSDNPEKALSYILYRMELVRGLWLNAVELEISEGGIWEGMARAWAVMIVELEAWVQQNTS